MSKSIDNSLSLKSIDGQTFSDEVVQVVNTNPAVAIPAGSIDHDSLANYNASEHIDWTSTTENLTTSGVVNTNIVRSIDADLDLRHHSTPNDTCVKITATGAELVCDVDFLGRNPGDSNYKWKIDGKKLSLTNTEQVSQLPALTLDEVLPGDVRFVVQIPPLAGTEIKGNYEYSRFNDTGIFALRELPTNPADNALSQFGYNWEQADPKDFFIRQRIPNPITGIGTDNDYCKLTFLRPEKGLYITTDGDPTETPLAKFTENTSEIYRPLKYTGSTPTAGYFLTTDIAGNASWAPVSGEVNDGVNVGTGSGVYKQKTGLNLELRSVVGGTGIDAITNTDDITLNIADSGVVASSYGSSSISPTFTVDAQGRITTATDVNIDHDALTGYVATEHIDWTGATDDFKTTGSVSAGTDYKVSSFVIPTATNEYLFSSGSELVDTGSEGTDLTNVGGVTFIDYLGRISVANFSLGNFYLEKTSSTYSNIDTTFACWFNYTTQTQVLMTMFNGTSNYSNLLMASNGEVLATKRVSGVTTISVNFGSGLNDGNWHYIVLQMISTGIKCYVDDVEQTGTFNTGNDTVDARPATGITTMRIGGDRGGPALYSSGYEDDVKFYTGIVLPLSGGYSNQTITGTATYSDKQTFSELALTDGSQGDGYMLMSDGSGKASWMGHRVADLYWESNATTTNLTPSDTDVKINVGTTTLNPLATGGWDLNGVQNRLRYTGSRGGAGHIGCTLSFQGSKDGRYRASIYKNGVMIPGSVAEFSTTGVLFQNSTAIHCMTSMSQNDYIELWCSCVGSTDTITVTHANIFCMIVG